MSDIVSSLVHPSGCKSVRYVSEIPSHYVKCNCLYFRPLRLENDYGRYNLKNVFRFCPACVEESSLESLCHMRENMLFRSASVQKKAHI